MHWTELSSSNNYHSFMQEWNQSTICPVFKQLRLSNVWLPFISVSSPFILSSYHPFLHLPLFCYMCLCPGVAMSSCHPNSSYIAATGGSCCPAAPNPPQPNTTAVGPKRPMSNSFFSECTEVWRIIFFFSSEALGVGKLTASPTQAHSLLLQLNGSLSCWYVDTAEQWWLSMKNSECNRNSSNQGVFKMKHMLVNDQKG